MGRYNISKSIEVYNVYCMLKSNQKGLYYQGILSVTGKSKNNVSNILRPLKESGFIVREWDKDKKDYLFKTTNKKYPKLICPCCGGKIK